MSDVHPLVVGFLCTAIGGMMGAIGGAWGANLALRERTSQNERRTDRLESKVGITSEGVLTGNGLIGDVSHLKDRVDERNDRQHPGWRQSHPDDEASTR